LLFAFSCPRFQLSVFQHVSVSKAPPSQLPIGKKLDYAFSPMPREDFRQLANFIWSIADLLRHDYKQADYGKVILPFTVLRRLDCVLQKTKKDVLAKLKELQKKSKKPENLDPVLNVVAGQKFHNRSEFDFTKLAADDQHPAANLRAYINGFSSNAREILEYFDFNTHIERLDRSMLLYQVIEKFNERDLHPDAVDNETMGLVFEELIRKFAEISNETAGEHFTPREVIELMVNILFSEDSTVLSQPGIVRTLYDPACGTGGMLAMGEDYVRKLNKDARVEVFGQEINPESYAICKADMLIKGKEVAHIKFGNVFTMDGLPKEKFDYFLSNPPFGVEWRKVEKFIRDENETRGWDGRFGAGLPRVSDGSLLFIEHMISKFKPASEGGSRLAMIFNGSPLFTGGPGSGESEIRRWIIENDWLEAIIALPDQLFFNTGISTYLWIVTNRKSDARRKRVQLIDASEFSVKMPRSLGNKRNLVGDGRDTRPPQIAEITKLHDDFAETPRSKIFDNLDFGYSRITVERPLRLAFEVTEERLEKIAKGETKIAKLDKFDEIERGLWVDTLSEHVSHTVWKNASKFEDWLKAKFPETPEDEELELLLQALSCKDETADPVVRLVKDPQPKRDAKALDLNRRGVWWQDSRWVEYVSDPDLRDFENVPLKAKIEDYFDKEVRPHVGDAWISGEPKIGYDVPFTRHFYQYLPSRPLAEIQKEVEQLEAEIQGMLKEVML
jgi:type I restriction enzyme M protein